MLEELQRRNYSQHTTRYYIRTVEDFARRFNCPPARLDPRHIREYQAELFEKRKLSSGSVAIRLAALRFFYCKTLRRAFRPREPSGELVSGRRGSFAGRDGAPNPGKNEQGQSGDPCA